MLQYESRPSPADSRPPGSSNQADSGLLDEALARVARLEATLAITGGTVHDVNNLLTALSGNLYLLAERARYDEEFYGKVRRARDVAERSSTLMRELLTFARDPEAESETVCPANHAVALEPLLRRGFGTGQCFTVRHGDEPRSVAASAAQFESAVINLVINARDALSERGTVELHVDNVRVDDGQARKLGVASGHFVCVRVVDDGEGISASDLPRVIEPLFTRKKAGLGSGLGLNMVQRFAQHCRGALAIDSVEGRGTEVRLWLPSSESHAEITANMTLPLSQLPGGDETVLLVSRDADVRAAVQDVLEALGYTVLLAALGRAVPGTSAAAPPPAVVICDRTPENRRAETDWLETVRRRYPQLRQVAVLPPSSSVDDAAPDAAAHLYRPIAVVDLARAMRVALES